MLFLAKGKNAAEDSMTCTRARMKRSVVHTSVGWDTEDHLFSECYQKPHDKVVKD